MKNEPESINNVGTPPEGAPSAPAPAPAAGSAPMNPTPHQATNGLAVASLVVGIVAILSGWIPFWGFFVGAAAVILGILGIKKAGGRGLAIAGIVTGGIGAAVGLFVMVVTMIAWASLATLSGTAATGLQAIENEINDADKESQAILDAKKDFAKGETGKFGNFEVKINSVERDYTPENSYMAAEDGKEYIVLNVTVKNVSDETEYVSSYDFDVSDNGLAVKSSYISIDGKLDSGDLASNASLTGNIVFEVTKGAADLKLQSTESVYVFGASEYKEVTYTLAF